MVKRPGASGLVAVCFVVVSLRGRLKVESASPGLAAADVNEEDRLSAIRSERCEHIDIRTRDQQRALGMV